MKIDMPFYPNTKDDTHCYQACMKMILKKIFPKRNFSYKKLEKLFNKPKGKYSWVPSAVFNLNKMGLKAKLITTFDYRKFARNGYVYLRSHYPKELADVLIKMSDIESEMKNAKRMLKYNLYEKRKTSMKGIDRLFKEGWLIIPHVNYHTLSNKKGYAGHAVLIIGITRAYVHLHDPGLPPRPNRKVSKKTFLKALRFPKNESHVLIIKEQCC
ncbi:MAG TPA: hypothetical protein VJ343_00555 [archaeon]|nr:hypothetical protein [archaeon]